MGTSRAAGALGIHAMKRALCALLLLYSPVLGSVSTFHLELNQARLPVRADAQSFAEHLDKDKDGFLSDAELEKEFGKANPRVLVEWKYALTNTRLPERSLYPAYADVQKTLQDLAEQHPECAALVSLGKSHEGRDLWALRLGYAPEGTRPAVVITGGTHAREWATVAVPLRVAERLLSAERRERLRESEVWIVPLVNPDGYEYSRDYDNSYRKNRRPNTGVDLNRNYSASEHPELYRRPEDKPDSTKDDVGASDRPQAETYRGPEGSSEPEVRALLQLQLGRGNVRGVLDNHSFGNMLLHPGNARREDYEKIARAINAGAGNAYKFKSANDLYAMTGNSMEVHHARGIVSITLEVGRSFQPPAADLAKVLSQAVPANLAFIDEVLRGAQAAGPTP
jgi:predicted deacylase